MLPLPDDLTQTSQLCDWVEMMAICSDDGNASLGDLERALDVSNYPEVQRTDMEDVNDETDDETPPRSTAAEADHAIETRLDDVYAEIEERTIAAAQGYPFTLSDKSVVQLKSDWRDYPAYSFCLCLSYQVWCNSLDRLPAAKLFEALAAEVAAGYIGGRSVPFGAPRRQLPAGFTEALEELSRRIGEGDGWSGTPLADAKDDALDVVAWRPFADELPGKLLLFGQCTTGYNWFADDKAKSLQPADFCGIWFRTPPFPPPVKTFFVPHAISTSAWQAKIRHIRSSGLFFDRCRIAHCCPAGGSQAAGIVSWTKQQVDRLH